ncbi:MAG: hypothetical protein ABS52_11200 [Gemmatimonadetes bacterium SCN 70-22]|nr:MAG: hypothetical protein ABS52_11200 [Gemmatimonadetes bacterium SCN 70-22]
MRANPQRALRDAIGNGIVHGDCQVAEPATVEHIGDRVTVTSPEGFVGGTQTGNIITHPSAPRYASLAHALSKLRLAERSRWGIRFRTLLRGRDRPSG